MSKTAYALSGFLFAALFAIVALLFPMPLAFRLVLLVAAGVLSIVSSLVLFGIAVDRAVLPDGLEGLVGSFAEEIEDDIDALRRGELTPTHIMVLITAVVYIVFFALVSDYGKLSSSWGPVPVIIPTLLSAALVAFVLSKIDWFRRRSFRTPFWVFLIPVVGTFLAFGLGIHMTEPERMEGYTRYESSQYYAYSDTRIYQWSSGQTWDLGGFDGADVDVDVDVDDDAAEALALLVLIVVVIAITIILVVGSAFIPHFWFLAGAVFVTILGMIVLRELKVSPRRRRDSWW